MKNNLQSEISKILNDQWLTKDKQVDAILALIKKHEREQRELWDSWYKERIKALRISRSRRAKLKDLSGLKEEK